MLTVAAGVVVEAIAAAEVSEEGEEAASGEVVADANEYWGYSKADVGCRRAMAADKGRDLGKIFSTMSAARRSHLGNQA